jgi:hypothetical protein
VVLAIDSPLQKGQPLHDKAVLRGLHSGTHGETERKGL